MEISRLALNHLAAFKLYAQKCHLDGLDLYPALENDYQAYLTTQMAYAKGEQLPAEWPRISTFFGMQAGIILGSIRFRHGTNDYIKNVIGHIGYEVSPVARGRSTGMGVATFMLNWIRSNILEEVSIITCDTANIASQKVIIKSGGQYLKRMFCEEENTKITIYQLYPATDKN